MRCTDALSLAEGPGRLLVGVALLALSCAGSEAVPPALEARAADGPVRDRSTPLDGEPARERARDQAGAPDRAPDSASCALGTPDHCGACGKACPPGFDPPNAVRVCQGASCELQCLEEAYDVDGAAANGCELIDDLPIHDLVQTARDLGAVSDCGNAISASGLLPSDGRAHLKAPTDRANGRADWFKLHIQDQGGCVVDATVAISLAGIPSGVSIRATSFWRCDDGSELAKVSKAAAGGASLTLEPSTSCTFLGDDSGTLYLELRKESGPHTAQGYTLTIEP